MNRSVDERKGHAVLDLPSRDLKAKKIASLLRIGLDGRRKRMLEVGCGSGGISHWFGADGVMSWDVEAVDVEDVRIVRGGYGFTLVEGTALPFPDASFDVVVSNHVIEHVGGQRSQLEHLQEMRRVLKPDGLGYLAVPNRWMLVEPHFKLPFLSWLPMALSDAYVRAAGKGTHYDCRPLTCARVEQLMRGAGLEGRQHTGDALRLTYELESPESHFYRMALRHLPDRLLVAARRIFPTLIYTFVPSGRISAASSAAAPDCQSVSVP